MLIKQIYIEGIRNLKLSQQLNLHQDLNIFIGPNGSGKTSLLETIYFLSLGRSFRTAKINNLINCDSTFMRISAVYSNKIAAQALKISAFKSLENAKINKIGETLASIAEIATLTPTQLINDETSDLVFKNSESRRKFIDWLAFYASKNYQSEWREFNRILQQRNKILKILQTGADPNLWSFLENLNEIFIKFAEKITLSRELIWNKFILVFEQVIADLELGSQLSVEIKFFKGWVGNLAEQLLRYKSTDLKFGHTKLGPHKADLKFIINKKFLAKEVLSRGQGKLLALTMILARSKFIRQYNENIDFVSVLLIDDLCAELDDCNISKVIQELFKLKHELQIFITGTEHSKLAPILSKQECKWFLVENGVVVPNNIDEITLYREKCSTWNI